MRSTLARWLRVLAQQLSPGIPWKKAAWHYRCAVHASNALVVKQALQIALLTEQGRKQRLCIAILVEGAKAAGDEVDVEWEDVPNSAGFLGGKRGGTA